MICGIIHTKAVEMEIEFYVNDKCLPFCLIEEPTQRYFSEFNCFISAVNNKSRFGLKQVWFGETMSAPGPSLSPSGLALYRIVQRL